MKYCVATTISTTDVYNNELLVESVHSDFDKALEKSTNGQSVIEINDHVKKGDSINSDGELWQSSNEATPSEQCKCAGLNSLAELVIITGTSEQTLINWHRNKSQLFSVVVAGAVVIKNRS